MKTRWIAWTAALVLLVCADAAADTLLLKDGRILEGRPMERLEGGVKVAFENGEVFVPDRLILDAILLREPPYVPKTPEEKEKVDQGLVLFDGSWVTAKRREELVAKRLEERRAKIDEIREHSLWRNRYKEETKHFEFEYTVPPHIFTYYRDLMETYYKEFAKTWKIKQPKDLGRLKVCFYTNYSDFCQIGGVPYGVLGYFKFVKPLELNFYYDRLDPAETEQVMYHETNHYLQKLIDPDFKMPHFPGESLAEYYGGAVFDPKAKKLAVGQVLEGRLTEVKNDIAKGDMMGLEKMITTDGMYEHYTWGWSLAHYLMNDAKYGKKFERFVKQLVAGKDVKQEVMGLGTLKTVSGPNLWGLFRKVMGLKKDDDVKALEDDWHAYVKDNLKLVSATGLEKAAQKAKQTMRPIRAKRLFREAIEAGSKNPLTFFRYADLLEDDRKYDEAIKHLKTAIELEPLAGQFYAALGRVLRKQGQQDEGKRYLSLARELDPDDPWLELELEQILEGGKDGE